MLLSSLLYSLFTHDCIATHDSNKIITFADDTAVVGLIKKHDETAYRQEVRDLAVWCQDNLALTVGKTNDLIVDNRKRRDKHAPIHIDGAVVERVKSSKLLGVHITKDLSWSKHTNIVIKGMTMPLPPQEAEKIWHGPSDPQNVIQLHH